MEPVNYSLENRSQFPNPLFCGGCRCCSSSSSCCCCFVVVFVVVVVVVVVFVLSNFQLILY